MSPLSTIVHKKFWPDADRRQTQSRINSSGTQGTALKDNFSAANNNINLNTPFPLKEGSYYINKDKAILRHSVHGDRIVLAPVGVSVEDVSLRADTAEKKEKYNQLSLLIQMRDTAQQILDLQENYADPPQDSDEPPIWHFAQQHLKTLYDSFTFQFGAINAYQWQKSSVLDDDGSRPLHKVQINLRHFKRDPDAYLVAAIEDFDEDSQTAKPSAIFERRILRARASEYQAHSIKSALQTCQDHKVKLDMDYIQTLLPNMPRQDIEDTLAAEDLAYFDPIQNDWVLAEEYLSGDIATRLEALEAYTNDSDERKERYDRNRKALKKALPDEVSIDEIDLTLGVPWIPPDIIAGFAQDELGLEHVTIDYSPLTHRWFVNGAIQDIETAHYLYGTDVLSSKELLEFALNAKEPTFRVRKDINGYNLNRELEKKLAADRMQDIKDRFKVWVLKNQEHARSMQTLYNLKMNSTVPRSYSGSYLSLAGSNVAIDMQKHQKKGIARAMNNPATLLEWDVGAGKTYASIAICVEGKRHGKFQKPLIVVQNHLLGQFARDFKTLYPRANILVVEDDQVLDSAASIGAEAKLRKLIKKGSQHDWDAILITKSSFDRLSVSLGRKIETLVSKIQAIDEEKDSLSHNYRALDRLGKEAVKLKLQIAELLELDKTDEPLQPSREQLVLTVKGLLHSPLDSDVWQDLIQAIEPDTSLCFEALGVDKLLIDEAHDYKNLAISSRLPEISHAGSAKANSFKEKLDYVREKNPHSFATFMTATPVLNALMEFYVFQTYLQPELLKEKGIEHPDAWISMFGEIAEDIELAPETGYYRVASRLAAYKNIPELIQLYGTISDVVTRHDLSIKDLPEIIDAKGKVTGKPQIIAIPESPDLIPYFESLVTRAIQVREGLVSSSQDNILKIINEARLATLDPRLAGLTKTEGGIGKIETCAEEIAKRYYAHLNKTYTSEAASKHIEPHRGALQMVLCNQGIPKGDGSFSVYEELKENLIHQGIPADKIEFIHDHTSDNKKEELFRKCRNGEISVLIGTTQKLGTGTNIQKRLIALHELDAPWRPGDVIQGRGRIDRPKNQNKQVEILTYVQEGSFDIYNWQMLERKARFIAQAKLGAKQRTFRDTDAFTAFCEDAKNEASNDPLLLEKGRTAQELGRLRFSKDALNNEKKKARKRLSNLKQEIEDINKQLERLEDKRRQAESDNAPQPTESDADKKQKKISTSFDLTMNLLQTRQKRDELFAKQKRHERTCNREFEQENRYKYLMQRRRIIDKKLIERQNTNTAEGRETTAKNRAFMTSNAANGQNQPAL
ncbi:MAG: helicase-related protein [Alphaproteobacteria bacterium]